MPLKQRSKSILRICIIGTTSSAGVAAAIIGSIVGVQGGNFWPWAFVSFAIYAIELTYASIAAIRYSRQPEQRKSREFYKRRRQRLSSR